MSPRLILIAEGVFHQGEHSIHHTSRVFLEEGGVVIHDVYLDGAYPVIKRRGSTFLVKQSRKAFKGAEFFMHFVRDADT